jgi:hypothetical protein
MKKIIFLLVMGSVSLYGFNQEGEKKAERVKLVKGGESMPSTTEKTVKTPEQELKSCENQLEALNKKEAYLRSNPAEMKVAEENGWFKDADQTRATLEARIKELKLALNK